MTSVGENMGIRRIIAAAALAGALIAGPAVLPTAHAPGVDVVQATTIQVAKAKPRVFKNCTVLNKVYRHGVASKTGRDRVKGKAKPVKNFTRNDAVYKANKRLDRDKDGVACEKR